MFGVLVGASDLVPCTLGIRPGPHKFEFPSAAHESNVFVLQMFGALFGAPDLVACTLGMEPFLDDSITKTAKPRTN